MSVDPFKTRNKNKESKKYHDTNIISSQSFRLFKNIPILIIYFENRDYYHEKN